MMFWTPVHSLLWNLCVYMYKKNYMNLIYKIHYLDKWLYLLPPFCLIQLPEQYRLSLLPQKKKKHKKHKKDGRDGISQENTGLYNKLNIIGHTVH